MSNIFIQSMKLKNEILLRRPFVCLFLCFLWVFFILVYVKFTMTLWGKIKAPELNNKE